MLPKLQLPDKPHCEIVKFYYTWKKTKTRISAIEKSQKKVATLKKDALDFLSKRNTSEHLNNFKTLHYKIPHFTLLQHN